MRGTMKAVVMHSPDGLEVIGQVSAGILAFAPSRVFRIDDIVDAHRTMEANTAGGKIVVLTR